MSEKRASQIRQELHGRIAALAQGGRHMSHVELVESIDTVRTLARSYGFATVCSLASRLESALARRFEPIDPALLSRRA